MAQVNFMLSDEGDTFTAKNEHATTAITAGDIVYASGATSAALGTTVPSGLGWEDIEVRSVKLGTTTERDKSIGIAEEDAAAGSQLTVRTRGLFFSPIRNTTCPIVAGAPVKPACEETTAGLVRAGTTTRIVTEGIFEACGVALTGSAVSGNYIVWMANFAARR